MNLYSKAEKLFEKNQEHYRELAKQIAIEETSGLFKSVTPEALEYYDEVKSIHFTSLKLDYIQDYRFREIQYRKDASLYNRAMKFIFGF